MTRTHSPERGSRTGSTSASGARRRSADAAPASSTDRRSGTSSAPRGAARTGDERGAGAARRTAGSRSVSSPGGSGGRGASGGRGSGAVRSQSNGPSRATFWRRRLLVLLVVATLVAGVVIGVTALVRALTAGNSSVDPATQDPSASAEATDGIDPDDAAPGEPTEDQLANPVSCVGGDVGLSVMLPSQTLPEGERSQLRLDVVNDGTVPCLLEVGARDLEVEIFSGEDLVWSLQHCPSDLGRRILLDVDGEDSAWIAWSGTRSTQSCAPDQPAAGAGSYRVVATVAGATAEQTFEVG